MFLQFLFFIARVGRFAWDSQRSRANVAPSSNVSFSLRDPCNAMVVNRTVSRHSYCQPRVSSSRLVLRWKETNSGHVAKARWCVHGFKDPHDIDEMERSFPTPEVASIIIIMMHIMMHIFASNKSYGTLAVGEKDPSARRQPLYVEPPLEGLPDVREGALIRLDREVCGLVSGMSGWRSKNSDRIVAVRLRHERV